MSSMWNNAINLISLLPSSYLPGLMVEVVKVGYAKNVFVPGGASRLIQKVEEDLPPNTQMQIDAKPCIACYVLVGGMKHHNYCHQCGRSLHD